MSERVLQTESQTELQAVLEAKGLSKSFADAAVQTTVFTDVNLAIAPGEKVAIVGASGSGKSTLVAYVGGIGSAR